MNTQPKVLKWALIVGIVIVLNMFFNYALSLAYKEPVYNDFCPTISAPVSPGDTYSINKPYETCQKNFDAVRNIYDRNVFIWLVVLGALCVFISNFLKTNMLISIALSFAGVLSFVIASMRYWSSADDLIKVIILGIALAILVWVAIKKFKDN